MPYFRTLTHLVATACLTGSLFLGPLLVGLIPVSSSTFEASAQAPRDAQFVDAALLMQPTPSEAGLVATDTPVEPPPLDSKLQAAMETEGSQTERSSANAADERVHPQPTAVSEPSAQPKFVAAPNETKKARLTASRAKKKKRTCVDGSDEIRKRANGSIVVPRSLIRSYTTNFKALNGLGWSATHKDESKKNNGVLLGGIRCGNDLHRAGFRSGDVIHSVNGHKVTTMSTALLTLAKVRNDNVVRVSLTRKGQAKTMVYRISS